MATQSVTIFKNIKETSTPFYREVSVVLGRIKNGASKDLVKNIRLEKDKSTRNDLKKLLPAICFTGIFKKRNDNSITEHSGLICLDFDGYPKKKDLLAEKERLSKNNFIYSVFISPSGNGLKALVKIPQDVDNHVNYFNSLEAHFNSDYFDKTCKNLSRVCYESYDPLVYVNENSSIWDVIQDIEYKEVSVVRDAPTIPITDENKIVDILVKWWTNKYPMSEGQRNQNAFILAMAFNDYGVNKTLASYILNNYATKDFNESEITRTINSAYANTVNFGTKYYEDEERVNNIKAKFRRGSTKKEIRQELEESDLDGAVIDTVLARVLDEKALKQFWTKSDKGAIKIVHILFKHFLEDNGFYKYCPEGGKNYVFVRVTNNLIDHTSEKEIKDFILNHLLELEDVSIYNYFADNTRLFREEFLTLLSTIDIYFISDTKDSAYLYYRNCAVHITKDYIKPIDYIDLGGYVWKDHVIDRVFNICEIGDCDYQRFIKNISSADDNRIMSMETTIGFMLHAHKNLAYCPAVILNDEAISDIPEGGTGKGLFMNALSKMKKVVTIDGKSFNFERSFPYQLVSADTQILVFDDVKKNFDFERLFSVVTEGLTLEKKNKDAIKIPFSKSPKVAITTNYAIKGSGNSFARRKWELELNQYYSKDFTPLDEFGKLMFGDWNDNDWCSFDNYMIECLQKYLDKGLIFSESKNGPTKTLLQETNAEFIEWCGLVEGVEGLAVLPVGIRLNCQKLYYDFLDEYPKYSTGAYKGALSRPLFYKYLMSYAKFKEGQEPEIGRDVHGKYMLIKSKNKL